jgi:hypothetical protein
MREAVDVAEEKRDEHRDRYFKAIVIRGGVRDLLAVLEQFADDDALIFNLASDAIGSEKERSRTGLSELYVGRSGGGCYFENAVTLLSNFARPATCRYHVPRVVPDVEVCSRTWSMGRHHLFAPVINCTLSRHNG